MCSPLILLSPTVSSFSLHDALPILLFRLIVSGNAACPVPSHSCDVGFPALIETDSYQGAPSGVPPRTHPAGPRPSGATATARSSALPLIKARQRMTKEPLSRTPSSVV